jgi:tetratricopeptide (TPR) repeat protein
MPENPRIEDLRRRVQKDPASIAFAQLGEEYRRAGHHREAVDVCRAGLAIHPGYLSARVTLGRALLELHELAAARAEFETVLKGAPENLAAVRGLAEVLHKSGELAEALAQYRTALTLARNDPDLGQTVAELTRQLTPKKGPMFDPDAPPVPAVAPAPAAASPSTPVTAPLSVPAPAAPPPPPAAMPTLAAPVQATADQPPSPVIAAPMPVETSATTVGPASPPPDAEPTVPLAPAAPTEAAAPAGAVDAQVKQTIEALEQWLDAIHVARSDRSS